MVQPKAALLELKIKRHFCLFSSYKSKIAPESSVRYFHLVMRKKITFLIVQYFSPKGPKNSLQKNGRKFGAFPLLGVEGLGHTRDTKVCDTATWHLNCRSEQNAFGYRFKLHCTHIKHTQLTHIAFCLEARLSRQSVQRVQTTPERMWTANLSVNKSALGWPQKMVSSYYYKLIILIIIKQVSALWLRPTIPS